MHLRWPFWFCDKRRGCLTPKQGKGLNRQMSARVPPSTAWVWGRMRSHSPHSSTARESLCPPWTSSSPKGKGQKADPGGVRGIQTFSTPTGARAGCRLCSSLGERAGLTLRRRGRGKPSSRVTPTHTPACSTPSAKAEGTLKEEQGSLTWEGSQPKAAALLDPDQGSTLA